MYSRKLDGKTLDFEHARFLYQSSFVMYDRQSISLWIHTTGKSVIGKHKNKILKFIPSTVTTWKTWRTEHPKTLVLNVKKGRNARFSLQKNPKSGGLSVGEPNGELKFYPFPILQEQRVVNDRIGGKNVVIVFDPDAWSFAAFERGERTFAWKSGKMLDQAGQIWNHLKGASEDMTMRAVPTVIWLTRAWKRFYPDGVVYSVE